LIGEPQERELQRERLAWHRMRMPKPIKQKKRPVDVNQLAHQLVELSTNAPTDEIPPYPGLSVYMAEIGSKGGKIGGKRRMQTMSARQRRSIAKKAAQARWGKKK